MDKWKFALAVIRETRMMPVFALGLLGATLVLARDVLGFFGVDVGEDAAGALRVAGLFVLGGVPVAIFRVLPRR